MILLVSHHNVAINPSATGDCFSRCLVLPMTSHQCLWSGASCFTHQDFHVELSGVPRQPVTTTLLPSGRRTLALYQALLAMVLPLWVRSDRLAWLSAAHPRAWSPPQQRIHPPPRARAAPPLNGGVPRVRTASPQGAADSFVSGD